MMKTKLLLIATATITLTANVSAARPALCKTSKAIANFAKIMVETQEATNYKVFFPQKITCPAHNHQYYAGFQQHNNSYTIYVDYTPDCHGVHTCNIGTLTTTAAALPTISYNMKDEPITTQVKLKRKLYAYFTPSHALGDFWPAAMQWRHKNILYTLNWKVPAKHEKQIMLEMTRSAI